MSVNAQDAIAQVLGQLLRQPEPQRDIELERALLRLQAARSNAAYLLLHRVLVLETALQQLQSRTAAAAGATGEVAVPLRQPASHSFLRDAAVVTAGMSDAPAANGSDGLDVEGWLSPPVTTKVGGTAAVDDCLAPSATSSAL